MRRHPLLWGYLFVIYFSLCYHLPIYAAGMSGSTGLRQTLLMGFWWLLPLVLLPRLARPLLALAGLAMWPAALTSLFYFILYGQEFSQSAIFIAFESNAAESSEFISSYWHTWFLVPIALLTAVPVWMWLQLTPVAPTRRRWWYAAVFALIGSWPFVATAVRSGGNLDEAIYQQVSHMEPAAPWNLLFGYAKYRRQLQEMEQLLARNRQLQPLRKLTVDAAMLPDTVVLVIGESTNRQRMSLYGYRRATTPQLDALRTRGELLVFRDVVTPRPYTIEALQQALSFADSRHPERFFADPNLLNLMKQVGYEITWITNQQTQTRRNTLLTLLSQMADRKVYLNNNRQQNASQYDEAVLDPFSSALRDGAAKRFIIVHLLGTHRVYSYRYPAGFARFDGADDVPLWVTPGQRDEYNSYDDAIRYNDGVVAGLIERTRARGDRSLLIYFSDHGEEVYDTPGDPFCGRNEGRPTPAMYTVPFLVWTAPALRRERNIEGWRLAEGRPYSTASFIYTLADMLGLDFEGMDRSASLVSPRFVAQPRLIGDPLQPRTLRDYATLAPPAAGAVASDQRSDGAAVM